MIKGYGVAAELLHPGNVVGLKPISFLGGELFDVYRSASANTSRYDPKTKQQICPISRFEETRRHLERAGFTVVPSKELVAAIDAVEGEKQRAREALDSMIAAVGERMAKKTGTAGLFPYQDIGARFLARRTRALLADEPGLGKTVQTIAALPPTTRAVILCPAVARTVWKGAIGILRPDLKPIRAKGKIPTPRDGEVVIASYEDARRLLPKEGCVAIEAQCLGTHLIREEAFNMPVAARCPRGAGDECGGTHGVIVPSDNVQHLGYRDRVESLGDWLVRRGKGEPALHDVYNRWNAARMFDPCEPIPISVPASTHLIADEAHFLKNRKSLRARAHRLLEGRARAAWLLTGTPLPNTPPELWAVLDAAGLAHLAFGSFDEFVEIFGGQWVEKKIGRNKKRRVVEWPRDQNEDLYQKILERARPALERVMLRRKKVEVLPDLPPKIYQSIEVEIDEAAIERECDRVQRSLEDKGINIDVIEDLDTIPIGEIAPLRKNLAKAKIPFAEEVCEEYEESNTPLVVFSAHVEPVQTIGSRKGWAYIDGSIRSDKKRQKIVDDFQAGKLRGVAASILAAGTALTLTRASNELFVDLDWVPANNEQASDRCHRIGQLNSVLIRTLVSSHPMDARVTEVLAFKSKLITAAIG